MKNRLLGLDTAELRGIARKLGEKPFRGEQMADWLYCKGVRQIDEMSNLPVDFKSALSRIYITGRSTIIRTSVSRDKAFKLLLGLIDGECVEAVGMLYNDRFSCCVSTQVGCPVGCLFCATGNSGFKRNLLPGEIIDQVLSIGEFAYKQKLIRENERISNIVFMGMGEPLLNYDATIKAVHLLNGEMGIGMRNITISTIGYVPGIYKLAKERLQLTLAISLHAADDELRRKIVPGMSRYKIRDIIQAGTAYFHETGRRITYEYCLLGGVNDSLTSANRLAELLKGLNCHVNVIPFNNVVGSGFYTPSRESIYNFCSILEKSHINFTVRERRGVEIQAACGQLRRSLI